MNSKTLYIILIILFVFSSLGFFFFRDRILFFLYGYEQSLIKSDSLESFIAFKKIVFGKKIFLAISMLLSFSCFISSYFVWKRMLYFNQQIVSIFFYISLIVSIIYLLGFILSFIIPTRIL